MEKVVTETPKNVLASAIDFTFFVECKGGSLNNSADGLGPRMDAETGEGLVSDVCIKRKLRNFLAEYTGERLYIAPDKSLNAKDAEIFVGSGVNPKDSKSFENDLALRKWICENFVDIRFFGAAVTSLSQSGYNSAQIAGPVVIGEGRSLDVISVVPQTITRQAVTTDKEAARQRSTMGLKFIVPYACYRINGSIDTGRAEKNGFTEEDAELLIKAILGMADIDCSAARPDWSVRDLWVFRHSSKWRDVPRYKLAEAITATLDPSVVVPRKYSDYTITLDTSIIPESVTIQHFN